MTLVRWRLRLGESSGKQEADGWKQMVRIRMERFEVFTIYHLPFSIFHLS